MAGLTYRGAGVDIEAGDRLVDRIRSLAARTAIPEIVAGIGGFAGCCTLPSGLKNPVLVSGTDGVGTKLKVAFQADRHDTVGIDLVAMCINDIITVGARPLFFLDYFATGRLDLDRAERVIKGIAEGCAQAECALLGGETAEMPGMYAEGEYDLAGFAVGVVDRDRMMDGSTIQEGDAVLGAASSGLHSNGYSLVRKVFLEKAGWKLDGGAEQLGEPLGEMLLRPTRIYVKAVRAALATGAVRGMCHVTGGGLPGNIPRVLPRGLGVELDAGAWHRPRIFEVAARIGEIAENEMYRTFNMGIGFVFVVAPDSSVSVLRALEQSGETAWQIGKVCSMPDATGDRLLRFI
jgi:phosphoribosylformylglycinamidine cyclo-ligase